MLVLTAVLTGAFLYISSGHFIKRHVLPRVSKAIGCDIQVREVGFAALRRLELRDVRVGDAGDPLLQAGTVRVRYRALSFLSGKTVVDEVLLDQVRIAATPEKLEALARPGPPAEKQPRKGSEPKKMAELLVRDVKVRDLGLSYVQAGTDAIEFEVSNLSLDLPELAVGKEFHLTVAAQAKARAGEQVDAEIKELSLNLRGVLGQSMTPSSLTLDVNAEGLAGTAGPVLLEGRHVHVAAEVTGGPANYMLRKFSVVESVGDMEDAALEANGSLGINPSSAVLEVMLDIAPNSLLNVIGAWYGNLDFGQTAVGYSGRLEFTSGQRFATRGQLRVDNLTVAAPGIPALRPLQVAVQHDLSADLAGKAVAVAQLDVKVSDGSRDVVTVKLDKAMALDLQDPAADAPAALSVRVDRFDLTLLNAFLAARPEVRILSGELNRDVTITVENGGRRIALEAGGGGVDHLIVQQGDRRIGPLRIDHEARLQLAEFNTLNIEHFKIALIPLISMPAPAATAVLDGVICFGEKPTGQLNARINGRSEKLAVLARPFLDDDSIGFLQPVLSGNVALYLDAQLHVGLDNGIMQLDESGFRVNGFGQDRLIDVALEKTSFAVNDLKRNPEKIQWPLRFAVNDLQLARLLPFLPPEAGVAKLAGNLKLNGRAMLAGRARTMRLETSASIEEVLFVLKNGTALSAPVTPSVDLSLDYDAAGKVSIERMTAVLRQAGGQGTLLNLEVAGHFDTGMDPTVRNVVDISTWGPVMLDVLEKLVVLPEDKTPPSPPPADESAEEATAPPHVWIVFAVAMEKAVYGDLLIQHLAAEAEYRNGKLDVSEAEVMINDGKVAATGVCDFGHPGKPQYDFRINGHDLRFAPVLATFIPRTALYTRGGVKNVEIELRGAGFDLASMQENLAAQVNMQLDQLVIERMSGAAGKLTEALLLGIFNLDWRDLSFRDGRLELAVDRSRFGDQDIHIQNLLLQAPMFQLDGSGTVQFGGAWTPDMEIKTGFIEAKADRLRRRGYAISTQADGAGYYAGPAIPLKGDLTSLRTQAGLVTEVLVRSGKLSPQDAMKADLVNRILGSLGGRPANGEKKTDVGGLIGGILGGVLESQSPQENETEQSDDPAEAIGNLLQGIFGN